SRDFRFAALFHDVLEQIVSERVAFLRKMETHVIEMVELERAVFAKRARDVESARRQITQARERDVGCARLRARVERRFSELDRSKRVAIVVGRRLRSKDETENGHRALVVLRSLETPGERAHRFS